MNMDRFDVLATVGFVMVGIGCALIYAPLGLIVPGAGLIGLAMLGARRASGTLAIPAAPAGGSMTRKRTN
jgi:hypothetical protein